MESVSGPRGPVEGPGEPQESTAITRQTSLPEELSLPQQQIPPPGPLSVELNAKVQAAALEGCSWPTS